MKTVICYLKISMDYGKPVYLWYKVKKPNPHSLIYFGEMKKIQCTEPYMTYCQPKHFCSAGVEKYRMGVGGLREQNQNSRQQPCKRGVVAMRVSDRSYNDKRPLFYISFGTLPVLEDRSVVYGEIIHGFDVLADLEDAGTPGTGKPKRNVRIVDCGEYTERKHGLLLPKRYKVA